MAVDDIDGVDEVVEAQAQPRKPITPPVQKAAPVQLNDEQKRQAERLARIAAVAEQKDDIENEPVNLQPTATTPPVPTATKVEQPEPTRVIADKDYVLPQGAVVDPFQLRDLPDGSNIDVLVEDNTTDQWKIVSVPVEKVRSVITAQDMFDRAHEGLDRSVMSTDMYDQNFKYHFGSVKEECNTNTTLRAMSYRPVREPANHFHRVRDVPGLGKVVCVGDAPLWAVPRTLAEAREAARLEKREKEKEEWINGPLSRIEGMVDPGKIDIVRRDHSSKVGTTTLAIEQTSMNSRRAEQQAEALERALDYHGMRSQRSFGGWDGPMSSSIPESPYKRASASTSGGNLRAPMPGVITPNRYE